MILIYINATSMTCNGVMTLCKPRLPGWGAVGQRYSLVGFIQRIAGFSHPSGKIANKPDYLGKIAVRQVQ